LKGRGFNTLKTLTFEKGEGCMTTPPPAAVVVPPLLSP